VDEDKRQSDHALAIGVSSPSDGAVQGSADSRAVLAQLEAEDFLRGKHPISHAAGAPLAAMCTVLCAFLLASKFAGTGVTFHALSKHFPHLVLCTHRARLPLSLVLVLFYALAARIGLHASCMSTGGVTVLAVMYRAMRSS
jgi:hypothetical protein